MKAEDDASDLQVPIFAILGILVFVGILGFAWFNFKQHQSETVANNTQVTQVGDLKPGSRPNAFADLTNGPRTVRPSAPVVSNYQNNIPASAPATEGSPRTGGSTTNGNLWKGFISNDLRPFALTSLTDEMSAYSSETIYFETASFRVETDSKGVSRLAGDVVLVNDALAPLSDGKFWIQIGGTRLALRRYSGELAHPVDLGGLALPSKSSVDCQLYAIGFKQGMKTTGRRTIGVSGLVAGRPVSFQNDLT